MISISRAKNLKGKVVLVRVDLNVPVIKKKVQDDSRIVESLPTIKFLIEKGAKIVLLTHLGRPFGKIVTSMKVDPVIARLSELLGKKIQKLETRDWKLSDRAKTNIIRIIDRMRLGQVVMMENIRFSPDEEKDTGILSQELAMLGDLFVLDGFAVAHRASASVSGIQRYLKSYAGILLTKEINGLSKVLYESHPPFVVVLGGAKIETKIPVMKNLLKKADTILIGGGLVNTYLYAKGHKIGASLVDKEFQIQSIIHCKQKKVIKPVDVIVGTRDGANVRVVDIGKFPQELCKKSEGIFDIGPKTIQIFAKYIKEARTLVWNGAMGVFEHPAYSVGTMSIARLIASRSKGRAFGVIGGGETLQAMDMVGMTSDIDLVSTGGGAMLEFLAGESLPGIVSMTRND